MSSKLSKQEQTRFAVFFAHAMQLRSDGGVLIGIWTDALIAFDQAFNTPESVRNFSDAYASDARRRMAEFGDLILDIRLLKDSIGVHSENSMAIAQKVLDRFNFNMEGDRTIKAFWDDSYSAFLGAFDTAVSRMKIQTPEATAARKQLYEFNIGMNKLFASNSGIGFFRDLDSDQRKQLLFLIPAAHSL